MSKRHGREEINPIIAYVRGEPLDNGESAGLGRSGPASELPTLDATMERVDEQLALSAELAAVRRSITRLEPSPVLRDSLNRYARLHPRGGHRRMAGRRLQVAVVAAVAAVAIGLAFWSLSRTERGTTQTPPALAAADPAPGGLDGFIRVRYALEGPQAYTVVRARLGRMGLVSAGLAVPAPAGSAFVDADLLLDIDGTVIGIRFVEQGPRKAGSSAGQRPQEDST